MPNYTRCGKILEQKRLCSKRSRPERLKYITTYGKPQYVKVKGDIQRIELGRGCPHQHDYCYEPVKIIDFPIPKIVRNQVQILDMNLICRKTALETIRELGKIRVNRKVVYYECVCGFDFRFLNQKIVTALKQNRFHKIRFAWDNSIKDQYRLKDTIRMFLKAGYISKDISLFMIVNWRISKKECERKLDIMKVWNVKVNDCCYDAGYRYAVPEYWSESEIKEFRAKCRKHNQIVNFGLDPQVKKGFKP